MAQRWDSAAYEKVFADGYGDNDIDRVLGEIQDATGVRLQCVWAYLDGAGFGGDSCLYVVENGVAYELCGALWPWLLDGRDGAPDGPGEPVTWKGPKADFDYRTLAIHGAGHNAAFEDAS